MRGGRLQEVVVYESWLQLLQEVHVLGGSTALVPCSWVNLLLVNQQINVLVITDAVKGWMVDLADVC